MENKLMEAYGRFKEGLKDKHNRGWDFEGMFNEFISVYKNATKEEQTGLRIKLAEDIKINESIQGDQTVLSCDLIYFCSRIAVPEAKEKLLDIFDYVSKTYNKTAENAFLYCRLIEGLTLLRAGEIKRKLIELSNGNSVDGWYKDICDIATKCLGEYTEDQ